MRIAPGRSATIRRLWASATLVTSLLLAVTLPAAAAAPANDAWTARVSLDAAGGSVSGSTLEATGELDEPARDDDGYYGNSVWYSFTPTSTGSYTFCVIPDEEPYFEPDTFVAVYTGASLAGLTEIGFNDDGRYGMNYGSELVLELTSGTEYSIAVGNYWDEDEGGDFVLKWGTADCIRPSVSLNTSRRGRTITVTVGAGDDRPGYVVECRIDGGTWFECSSAFTRTYRGAPTSVLFEARVTDAAGNQNSRTRTVRNGGR